MIVLPINDGEGTREAKLRGGGVGDCRSSYPSPMNVPFINPLHPLRAERK